LRKSFINTQTILDIMSYYFQGFSNYMWRWVPGAARNYTGNLQYLKDHTASMVALTEAEVQAQLKALKPVIVSGPILPETVDDFLSGHPRYNIFTGVKRKESLLIIAIRSEFDPIDMPQSDQCQRKMAFVRKVNRAAQCKKNVLKELVKTPVSLRDTV